MVSHGYRAMLAAEYETAVRVAAATLRFSSIGCSRPTFK
jgi:hypothetical protein